MKIAIIGGGAAGFFSAINVKENHPNAKVIIFEKSKILLAKVKVSGGGRCNVTNGITSIDELCKAYPRGGRKLKKIFHVFNTADTIEWFESRGVSLYVQENNCVFPKSQKSQSIIDCFLNETKRLQIEIELETGIKSIEHFENQLEINFLDSEKKSQIFDKVIVATGGSPKRSGLNWLEDLNHKIEDPVPSLFTFNMPTEPITKLMGISVNNVLVSIQDAKLKYSGPLLITHWGMSGPIILKLSAFGARTLYDKNYQFSINVNWMNESNNDLIFEQLRRVIKKHSTKFLSSKKTFTLPERLWLFLLEKSSISADKKWGDIGKKDLNKLVNILTNDVYLVKGKTTFKEEFVTCGGLSLESIDLKTMQSKVCKNLYFAGEIIDVDGITGGYNFQAAWTTGFIAGKLN